MRGFKLFLICFSVMALLLGTARAATYTLADGKTLSGDPISFTEKDALIKTADGKYEHVNWEKFSNDSLKELAQDPKAAKFIEPFLEQTVDTKVKAKEITIKPVAHPERPTGSIGFFTLFSSPLGLVILLILYGANVYAAYEVALFRNQPYAMTCGLAAIPFLGFLSPIIFLCMPSKGFNDDIPIPGEEVVAGSPAEETVVQEQETVSAPPPSAHTSGGPTQRPAYQAPNLQTGATRPSAPAPETAAPATPAAPTSVTFRRGEFTFNRRFFETKMPGFFRVVPSEAEKDMVLVIKSTRGEFVGKRIMHITQSDLDLQTFKENVTADEKIPFAEISEVQLRHKDAV